MGSYSIGYAIFHVYLQCNFFVVSQIRSHTAAPAAQYGSSLIFSLYLLGIYIYIFLNVTQIRGPSSLHHITVRALLVHHQNIAALSSIVDSRRLYCGNGACFYVYVPGTLFLFRGLTTQSRPFPFGNQTPVRSITQQPFVTAFSLPSTYMFLS